VDFVIYSGSISRILSVGPFSGGSSMAHKITDSCVACGACMPECPVEAISEGDIYKIDPEKCTDCGTCVDICPSEAIVPA
jgi:ferredoxin